MSNRATRPSIKTVREAIAFQGYLDLPRLNRGPLRVSVIMTEKSKWLVDAGPGCIVPLTATGRCLLTEIARDVLARRGEIEAQREKMFAQALLR